MDNQPEVYYKHVVVTKECTAINTFPYGRDHTQTFMNYTYITIGDNLPEVIKKADYPLYFTNIRRETAKFVEKVRMTDEEVLERKVRDEDLKKYTTIGTTDLRDMYEHITTYSIGH